MILVILIIIAVICALLAHSKGRNPIGWFFVGFFFGLIGVIVLLVIPNLNEQREKDAHNEMEQRRLRELLRQEQFKNERFREHAQVRLDAHDGRLGMDTRNTGTGMLLEHNEEQRSALPEQSPETPSLETTANTFGWYYQKGREAVGPVYLAGLQQMIREGQIAVSTQVWHESLGNWTPAQDVGPLNMEIEGG